MPPVVEQLAINGFGGLEDPNSVSFNLSPIATRNIGGTIYQACAYKSSSSKLVVGKRVYGGAWTLFHYDGVDKVDLGTIGADQHHVSVVEIDADGLVHIAFHMHNDPLVYRRSDASIATWTGGVTAALSMLGTNETQVSYPCFFRSPTGTLYFTFRDGPTSGDGDQYFYQWNDTTDVWAGAAGLTAGKLTDGKTNDHSAYLNGAPKFTSDWDGAGTGFLHWSWMWRALGGDLTTNQDIIHVKWDGTNWTTYSGSAQTVPITPANADVVWAIGPAINLLNQVDFDLTSTGRPVVAVLKNDASAVRQLYALYHNGTAWANHQITTALTSSLPRPIVLVDRATDVCYIIGGDVGESRRDIFQRESAAGDFTTWTRKVFYSRPLYGGTELNYDRTLWLSDKIITGVITRQRKSKTNIEIGILETDTAGVDPRTLGGFPGFH